MEQKLYSIYDDLKKTNEFPSLEMIKQVFRNKTGTKNTLIGVYNNVIKNIELRVGTEYAPGTLKEYKASRNVLQQFLKEIYMSSDIEITKLNDQFMSSFEIFLAKRRGNCLNRIHKQGQRLKTVI